MSAGGRLLVLWPVDPWVGSGADMGGLGDALEGCRVVPYVAPYCPDAVLAVRRPLVRLFSRLGLPVVAFADLAPGASGSSLPPFLALGVPLPLPEAMALPPLWADERLVLAREPGKRLVGLCWHGSGGGRSALDRDDDFRCVPPATLAPLLDVPGVVWIGLQLADHARELPIPGLDALGVRDFADTAGIMKQLDLVVTVDTSVAHLAGNLGLPTWLLLVSPRHAGWDGGRWDRSPPLYPTVRQFRQAAPGAWGDVVDAVRAALETER